MSCVLLCISSLLIVQLTALFAIVSRIYVQPPNAATVEQRQAAMARRGLTERNVNGRTHHFRFAEPTDERPCRLADNLTNFGMFWQEWEFGIGGNKPAKLWTSRERGCSTVFSRRKPIYLLLNRTINIKGKMPAEAFRLMETHFPGRSYARIAEEIRRREKNGTMHADLADPHNPLPFFETRKRKRN